MLLLPLPTPLLRPGDDLAGILAAHAKIMPGDILVVSSKAAATVEGATIALTALTPSPEAEEWSERMGRSAAFCEAVLREIERLHGKIIGWSTGAILTELQPDGFPRGTILTANAGLDESNTIPGTAVGWPRDPVGTVKELRRKLGNVALILSDSVCHPRRIGVTAQALAVSGMDPLQNLIGNPDLFGRSMTITKEAVADQLATAANAVMGNAAESIPAALLRDHGLPLSDFEGWVEGIEKEEDLFRAC